MRPYLSVLSARFRLLLQYRAAALAGVFTQFFWGIMHVMILQAFYASVPSSTSLPMTLDQAITYTWLVQAFLLVLPWTIDREVEQMIRTGNVVYELIRPIDLYSLWFSRALAWRSGSTVLRIVPVLLIAYLTGGLEMPPSLSSLGLFVVSMIASIGVSTALTTLMMIFLFWTISSAGLLRLMTGLVVAFSGMQIPLPLYPDWAQPLLSAMPFRSLVDIPFRIYLGHIPPNEAWIALLQQCLWVSALVLFGRWLIGIAQHRLVVHGG